MIGSFYGSAVSAFSSLVTYFRKEFRTSNPLPSWKSLNSFANFNSYPARLSRYALYWAFFENTAYDSVHSQADSFKAAYSLYRYTRGVYNPCHRLGDLWPTLINGGALDPRAGDGQSAPSVLPITTKDERIRPAIARLWRDSNWQVNKTMFSRLGTVMGDVALRVNDDPEAGMVTLEVVNAMTIQWIDADFLGNVKAYRIVEQRYDPRYDDASPFPFANPAGMQQVVTRTEDAWIEGGAVHYRTYLDGQPYGWEGQEAEWTIPYPFLPMVLVNHMKMCPEDRWGWSEYHAGVTKFCEADDLGSKLHDQIRKIAEGAWLMTGVAPPSKNNPATPKPRTSDATTDDPDPGRQEMKVMYGGMGATAIPLILPLDIQFTSLEIQNIVDNFKEDYPELQYDSARVSGDASGKALREVRKKAEAKVMERRAVYDAALVKAQQMAIAIGGWRGYAGYDGFGLESFGNGDLEHSIGKRTVFEVDVLDEIEKELAFWQAALAATQSGCPLEVYLRRNRWTDEQIADFAEAKATALDQMVAAEAAKARAIAQAAPKPGPSREPAPQSDAQAAQAGA